MVRKAALQAIGLVVESGAQASQQDSAGCTWLPVYIQLAETLCSLLTVAPDSLLASQDLQQASHLATACTGFIDCLRQIIKPLHALASQGLQQASQ